jgi:hypothetical protein
MHFYKIVSVDNLLLRLADDEDKPAVSKAMTSLLVNSFYPQGNDLSFDIAKVSRCLKLIRQNLPAAQAFYGNLIFNDVTVGSVSKFCWLLFSLFLSERHQLEALLESEEQDNEEQINNFSPQIIFNIHDNFLNLLSNNQEINNIIDEKYNEIISYAYDNMMNINDEIIKFIDYCYLKNLQYDDEPIDTIRYTIRTIFDEGVLYEIKQLSSNIFAYSMIGINMLFDENFALINDILNEEIKRLLRRSYGLRMLSYVFSNNVNHACITFDMYNVNGTRQN